MDIILHPLIDLTLLALTLIKWTLGMYVVINLFIQLNFLNKGGHFIDNFSEFLDIFVNPLLKKVGKIKPSVIEVNFPVLIFLMIVYCVYATYQFLDRFLKSSLNVVRKIIPPIRDVDCSLLILFILYYYVTSMVERALMQYMLQHYVGPGITDLLHERYETLTQPFR